MIHVLRAAFVDLEATVIDEVRCCSRRQLFHPEQGRCRQQLRQRSLHRFLPLTFSLNFNLSNLFFQPNFDFPQLNLLNFVSDYYIPNWV